MTESPRFNRWRTRLMPRKPAPPVTSQRTTRSRVDPVRAARTSRQYRRQRRAHLRGRRRDGDAGGLQRRDLVLRRALATRDDRAGVTHALARRRRLAADERGARLPHVLLDELRGALLGVATDLADHEDRRGARILREQLQR